MLAIAYADKAADVLGGSDVELQVQAPHGLFMPRSAHQTLDAELVPAPPARGRSALLAGCDHS